MVRQVELHHVALTDADERAGDGAAIGPEGVLDAIGKAADDLAHLQVHDDVGAALAGEGRWHPWRRG